MNAEITTMASLEWDDGHDALAEADSTGAEPHTATVDAATCGPWLYIGPHQAASAAHWAAYLFEPLAQWTLYHPALHQPHLLQPPTAHGSPILYHLHEESARKKCFAFGWPTHLRREILEDSPRAHARPLS